MYVYVVISYITTIYQLLIRHNVDEEQAFGLYKIRRSTINNNKNILYETNFALSCLCNQFCMAFEIIFRLNIFL